MKWRQAGMVAIAAALHAAGAASGENWPRFRGPNGAGISAAAAPVRWSDAKGIRWKCELPGPGSSSPVIWGGQVFVTCYSGYAADAGSAGELESLKRHVVCVDRQSGRIQWTRVVPAVMPEDLFQGIGLPQHGYASNTPVTDGERLYVFFGKSGVLAYDLSGRELWRADVGHESSNRRWGSGASLVLYKNLVIVNASDESQSVRALDKATGQEVWRAEAISLELAYDTPALVPVGGERVDLVIAVPDEVWGLNPDTGKLRWYAETRLAGNICPSPIWKDGVAYVFGGYRSVGSLAVRVGGEGDVTDSHIVWASRNTTYVPTPLLYDGRLYWVDENGVAHCAEAATGKLVYRERLPLNAAARVGGKAVYASIIKAGDALYATTRRGGVFVLAAKPEFEVLAHNRIAADESDFNATPAAVDGQLLLRSNRCLYCIGSN